MASNLAIVPIAQDDRRELTRQAEEFLHDRQAMRAQDLLHFKDMLLSEIRRNEFYGSTIERPEAIQLATWIACLQYMSRLDEVKYKVRVSLQNEVLAAMDRLLPHLRDPKLGTLRQYYSLKLIRVDMIMRGGTREEAAAYLDETADELAVTGTGLPWHRGAVRQIESRRKRLEDSPQPKQLGLKRVLQLN